MKKLLCCGALLMSVVTAGVQAKQVAGIELETRVSAQGQELKLNGAGVRSKFFMDLYVGSLYLPEPQTQLEAVLAQNVAAVRLNITSGMITSKRMTDAITEGFELAAGNDLPKLQEKVDTFMAMFTDEITEGDQFTFVTTKDQGVESFKNGQSQGSIEGEDFRQALLKIWLGDKPAQRSLRKAMLAQ
ncbi:chalcone isomerase family protein [Shewanella maritima]|uniref:chalcone isomerase family protein n=1 Tax=Shewanella maritima TaxID=2520507 RepID=UPI003736F3FF